MDDHYDDTGLTGRVWFKPLVALWFGVLAAAGMWFMPPDIHNAILSATGLAGLHPVLAVPVGRGGVIALCTAVGLLGALLGFLIAWRLASAGSPRGFAPGFGTHDAEDWADEEVSEEPRRRRVFSAREDIGEEGIAISAPPEEHDGEADYEDEYSIEDIPQVSPEEDFETVYAGMDPDYRPSEDGPEPIEIASEEVIEIEVEPVAEPAPEYADFEEVAEPGEEPQSEAHAQTSESDEVEAAPENESEPLGDMSLDALVGRLGSALDQHRKLVTKSEKAALQPAPQTPPMAREPGPSQEGADHGLPEVADDDPVIAFLRREASRRMPGGDTIDAAPGAGEEAPESPPSQSDAQAALRSALDRLGQANRRDS